MCCGAGSPIPGSMTCRALRPTANITNVSLYFVSFEAQIDCRYLYFVQYTFRQNEYCILV